MCVCVCEHAHIYFQHLHFLLTLHSFWQVEGLVMVRENGLVLQLACMEYLCQSKFTLFSFQAVILQWIAITLKYAWLVKEII